MHVQHLLVHVMCVLVYVHEPESVNVCILVRIHVHVCVAPPIVVGAWPMAGMLWWLFEYYYYNTWHSDTYIGASMILQPT